MMAAAIYSPFLESLSELDTKEPLYFSASTKAILSYDTDWIIKFK